MTLTLYNTLTRSEEPFTPIDPANVRMYVCGPTVYDYAHIGNARPVIVFDVLFRLLRHLYGPEHVAYVRNITDVDDKINDRAARDFPDLPLNDAIRRVTETTAAQFHADVKALGCLEPTHEPRATEHIEGMKEIIEVLVRGGFAYAAEGHVLFSPSAMNAKGGNLPRYGALANRSLDEMIAGARVDVAPYKKDATDFVLWKPSKPGEPGWLSPCGIEGLGRPGWHIECSAMSRAHLGEVFDIHGGGIDLVFPHHENELAQSTCAFGRGLMARVWMHNGFLQVEGQKMSKSLGNFVTIHQLLETETFGGRRWPGDVLRLAMLKTHYRQPIDFTVKALEEAERNLASWRRTVALHPGVRGELHDRFLGRLARDLKTKEALDLLHVWAGYVNGTLSYERGGEPASDNPTPEQAASFMVGAAELLGLDLRPSDDIGTAAEALIAARLEARRRKDFAESDRIRDELAAMGIALKDGKDPTTGEPVTTWEVKR